MIIMSFLTWLKNIIGCREDELNQEILRLNQLQTILETELKELQKKYDIDSQYYEERIKTLESLLIKTIAIPIFSEYSGKVIEDNPMSFISSIKYRYSQADNIYYTLDYDDWLKILSLVKQTFQATWTEEIFDCDDFALLFAGILAYSVYKSGFKRQFAFGIAWSNTHAFCLFITKEGRVFIYEPQNNTIKGELGKTSAPYDVKEIWFMS